MRGLMMSGAMLLAGLTACTQPQPEVGTATTSGPSASLTLRTAAGASVGKAVLRDVAGGLSVSVAADGMTPGVHGAHLHTVGKCDAPDFASAGPHWNPTGMKHGSMNAAGPHEGDLPNLTIGADGKGTLTFTIAGGSLASLLDADGAALVIHAAADDLMTDPSGNSGARIACGVVSAD